MEESKQDSEATIIWLGVPTERGSASSAIRAAVERGGADFGLNLRETKDGAVVARRTWMSESVCVSIVATSGASLVRVELLDFQTKLTAVLTFCTLPLLVFFGTLFAGDVGVAVCALTVLWGFKLLAASVVLDYRRCLDWVCRALGTSPLRAVALFSWVEFPSTDDNCESVRGADYRGLSVATTQSTDLVVADPPTTYWALRIARVTTVLASGARIRSVYADVPWTIKSMLLLSGLGCLAAVVWTQQPTRLLVCVLAELAQWAWLAAAASRWRRVREEAARQLEVTR